MEQKGFFFKEGQIFLFSLGPYTTAIALLSFQRQQRKGPVHVWEAKLRSAVQTEGEMLVPEQPCRARTACLQHEVQRNEPRAQVSNSRTEQESPISPVKNIWMFHNFCFLEPSLKPITLICMSLSNVKQKRSDP